jgi:hypothetical protein
MQFSTYEKKVWYNKEESFCKKVPLKCIATKTIPFNPLVAGEYPGENGNTNANLMFTADFANTQGVFLPYEPFYHVYSFFDTSGRTKLGYTGFMVGAGKSV